MPRRRGRGEGSLEELPSGKWRAVLTDGKMPDGGQNKVSATFEKRRQAVEWLEEQRSLRRTGATYAQSGMSVKSWLEQWLKLIRCRISEGSWRIYERRCRLHLIPAIGEYEMRQLTPLLVGQLPAKLYDSGATPKTARQLIKTLKQALKEAVLLKVIYSNPLAGQPLPRSEKTETSCWTKEEAQKFLASVAQHKHYALFLLALDTGMRKGEILALRLGDVNLVAGYLDVRHTLEDIDGKLKLKPPKTAKSKRRIWFSEATRRAIVDMAPVDTINHPVFTGRDGGFMWVETINRSFAEAVKRAGVPPIRFHDLRHTCATLLLQAGVGIKTVSERLGHANVAITLGIYTHVLPGEQEAVARVTDNLFGSHTVPTEAQEETKVQVNDSVISPWEKDLYEWR